MAATGLLHCTTWIQVGPSKTCYISSKTAFRLGVWHICSILICTCDYLQFFREVWFIASNEPRYYLCFILGFRSTYSLWYYFTSCISSKKERRWNLILIGLTETISLYSKYDFRWNRFLVRILAICPVDLLCIIECPFAPCKQVVAFSREHAHSNIYIYIHTHIALCKRQKSTHFRGRSIRWLMRVCKQKFTFVECSI